MCPVSSVWKVSGSYFPVFGLNREIYGVNLRIQSEYKKIRTRNNFVFGHFSNSDSFTWQNRFSHVTLKPNHGIIEQKLFHV